MRRPAFRALLMFFAISTPALQAQRTVDPVVTTDVSGYRGQVTWVMLRAGRDAMSGVEWRERSDKPCALAIGKREMRDPGPPAPEYTPFVVMPTLCPGGIGGSVPLQDDNSKRVVHVEDGAQPGQVMRGVQVCSTNANNHRLKGIRVYSAIVNVSRVFAGDTTASSYSVNGYQEARQPTNCDVWRPAVFCPDDHVASGLAVHRTDDEIVGLALRCRRVAP